MSASFQRAHKHIKLAEETPVSLEHNKVSQLQGSAIMFQTLTVGGAVPRSCVRCLASFSALLRNNTRKHTLIFHNKIFVSVMPTLSFDL